MKKTFKTMLALMAGAMTFTGCTSDILENTPEQIPSALKPMTFTAIQEGQGDATRTAIDGTAINWTENDAISIFDGVADEKGNYAREFTIKEGDEGKPSGTFTGEADPAATTYYALYPYSASTKEEWTPTQAEAETAAGEVSDMVSEWKNDWWMSRMPEEIERVLNDCGISPENQAIIFAYLKGETVTFKNGPQRNASNQFENVVLPAAQTATAGSADPKAMLMIAKSTDASTLEFKNVCAFVKVTPQFACTRITLKSNGTESLAGTLTVDYNDGNPTTTVTANGTNTVTLSGDIAATSTYYIAVRPETLKGGFTIVFTTTDNRYKKSTSKEVTFTRSEALNLGSFETSKLTPIPTKGIAKREGDIEVNWVQLWENGPKFAEYNVGADDNKAEHYGVLANWAEDFVSSRWGTAWRLATSDEFDKLISECKHEWKEGYNGTEVKGLLVTGKEGTDFEFNSIFLPAFPDRNWGYSWSSTVKYTGYPNSLYFEGDFVQIDQPSSANTYPARAVLNE